MSEEFHGSLVARYDERLKKVTKQKPGTAVIARIIKGMGLPVGVLSGIYLYKRILPIDASFWLKLTVGGAISVAVLFLFWKISDMIGGPETSED